MKDDFIFAIKTSELHHLEPVGTGGLGDTPYIKDPENIGAFVAFSQAISLKRIADALERMAGKPADPEEPWIEWDGGDVPPVPGVTLVQAKARAGWLMQQFPAFELNWSHSDNPGDIVAYRVVK